MRIDDLNKEIRSLKLKIVKLNRKLKKIEEGKTLQILREREILNYYQGVINAFEICNIDWSTYMKGVVE